MTSKEREEQRMLLEHVGLREFAGLREPWYGSVVHCGWPLDRILESAAYAWTDGPEDES